MPLFCSSEDGNKLGRKLECPCMGVGPQQKHSPFSKGFSSGNSEQPSLSSTSLHSVVSPFLNSALSGLLPQFLLSRDQVQTAEDSELLSRNMTSLTCKPCGWLVWTLIVLMLGTSKSQAQNESSTIINILLIYEEPSTAALFDVAQKYAEQLDGVRVGAVHRFLSNNASEPLSLTKEFCVHLSRFLASEHPPDLALDFTRIGPNSEAVKVLLRAMQIPTVAGTFGQDMDVREWRDLTGAEEQYLIQVSPPADMLIQAVRSIVAEQVMTSAVLLFDETYSMEHKYKALLQNMPTRHLLTRLDSANLTGQITKLVHVDITNFFIAASPNAVSEVLLMASNPRAKNGPYFSDEFAWYSMSMEEDMPLCRHCESNVTLVHLSPHPETTRDSTEKAFLQKEFGGGFLSFTQLFYFDLALAAIRAVKALKEADEWNHDASEHSCVNWTPQTNSSYPELELRLMDAFSNATRAGSMFSYQLQQNGRNFPKFRMKMERLSFRPGQPEAWKTEQLGSWAAGLEDNQLISFRPGKNLSEHKALVVYRVVVVVQEPFVMRVNCTPNETDKYRRCFKGFCLDLLKKLAEELGFNYTIREVDSGYGYMSEETHEWNGMVRELQFREADIALGAMSVMAEREGVLDFTVPYYDLVGISILMKKPRQPTSLFKFLAVLETDVWMCILGAFFCTSILMWVFDRWSPYSYQNNRSKYEDDEEKRVFTLKECFWFCMTSLTPQGGGEAPKNLSGRLAAATWWLFGFIILASYTANLAAFLTVQRLNAPIESLEDLSKQYKVQYAPLENSSTWIYFDRMAHIEHRFYEVWKEMSLNDSLDDFERSKLAVWDYPVSDKYTKLWQAMIENTPPTTREMAIERVKGINITDPKRKPDDFAFLDEATNVKWQTTISCDFEQKGEEFSRKPYAIAVQKGSPLKESFSHLILKYLNERYLEQLKETWWNTDKPKCPRDDYQSEGISIHNIGGVFIIVFAGIIVALFTLLFEYWWYRKRDDVESIEQTPDDYLAPRFGARQTGFGPAYDRAEPGTLSRVEKPW